MITVIVLLLDDFLDCPITNPIEESEFNPMALYHEIERNVQNKRSRMKTEKRRRGRERLDAETRGEGVDSFGESSDEEESEGQSDDSDSP